MKPHRAWVIVLLFKPKEYKMDEQLLTPAQVARHIGIATATLARHRSSGNGPAYIKLGRIIRYRHNDVIQWLRKNSHNLA